MLIVVVVVVVVLVELVVAVAAVTVTAIEAVTTVATTVLALRNCCSYRCILREIINFKTNWLNLVTLY